MARRRHLSRIAVMQVLFEQERHKDIDPADALARNVAELGEVDTDFADTLLAGVTERHAALEKAIEEHAPGWTLDRMDPVSRCILMVGAFELMCSKEAPAAVVINEAIEIAKEYATDESGKFVNGVLNAIAHANDGSKSA
jgi:N utilization substance protein B